MVLEFDRTMLRGGDRWVDGRETGLLPGIHGAAECELVESVVHGGTVFERLSKGTGLDSTVIGADRRRPASLALIVAVIREADAGRRRCCRVDLPSGRILMRGIRAIIVRDLEVRTIVVIL
jgi:hypothetical protein